MERKVVGKIKRMNDQFDFVECWCRRGSFGDGNQQMHGRLRPQSHSLPLFPRFVPWLPCDSCENWVAAPQPRRLPIAPFAFVNAKRKQLLPAFQSQHVFGR